MITASRGVSLLPANTGTIIEAPPPLLPVATSTIFHHPHPPFRRHADEKVTSWSNG